MQEDIVTLNVIRVLVHSVAVFCEWRRVIFVRMFGGAFNVEKVALVYENVTCAFVLLIMREIQHDGPPESNTFFVLKRIVLKQCFLRIEKWVCYARV